MGYAIVKKSRRGIPTLRRPAACDDRPIDRGAVPAAQGTSDQGTCFA
jgi:hypothetical protein